MKREVGEGNRSCYPSTEVKVSVMKQSAEWWRRGRAKQFQFLTHQCTTEASRNECVSLVVVILKAITGAESCEMTVSPHGVQESPVIFQPQ